MMDFNIEVRRKQLQSLDQYISSSKDKVQSILDCLGWSAEKVINADEQVTCSFNKSHIIHPKRAVDHVEKCQIKGEGYDLKEQFLSEPLNHPLQSITIDPFIKIRLLTKARSENPGFIADLNALVIKLLIFIANSVYAFSNVTWNGIEPDPRTSDRLFSTFSPDERLALYDFCVQHTKGPPVPPEVNMASIETNKDPTTLSDEALRALERDAKRRQVKYKSVHTNRKTYTEVMKQVIENQMAVYEDWMKRSQQITISSDCENKYYEQRLHSPLMDAKIPSEIDFQENDSVQNPSSNSSKYEKNETITNIESKHHSELEGYEQSYDTHKRQRSPSECSNTSSNKSRRRDADDKYSRTSRHSSLDSSRSSYKHSEEKYKAKDNYQERDKEYRRYQDEKNRSNGERDDRRYRRSERKSENRHERQELRYEKHRMEERCKVRNGKEVIECERSRKDKTYQQGYEKEDGKYTSSYKRQDGKSENDASEEGVHRKYREDRSRVRDMSQHSNRYSQIHKNKDDFIQRRRSGHS